MESYAFISRLFLGGISGIVVTSQLLDLGGVGGRIVGEVLPTNQ